MGPTTNPSATAKSWKLTSRLADASMPKSRPTVSNKLDAWISEVYIEEQRTLAIRGRGRDQSPVEVPGA